MEQLKKMLSIEESEDVKRQYELLRAEGKYEEKMKELDKERWARLEKLDKDLRIKGEKRIGELKLKLEEERREYERQSEIKLENKKIEIGFNNLLAKYDLIERFKIHYAFENGLKLDEVDLNNIDYAKYNLFGEDVEYFKSQADFLKGLKRRSERRLAGALLTGMDSDKWERIFESVIGKSTNMVLND